MRSSSNTAQKKENQEFDQEVKNSTVGSKLALRWLRRGVAEPKEWAQRLGFKTDRNIYKWANGEAPIPPEHVTTILEIARLYAIPIGQLRDETDLYLAAQRDPGVF